MSVVIGEDVNGTYSTWGYMRTPIAIEYPGYSPDTTVIDVYSHSLEYSNGFRASEGGLFRTYRLAGEPSTFYLDGGPPPPPPASPSDSYFRLTTASAFGNFPPFDQYELAGLTGATITMTSGSFTLTADAWMNA